MICCRVTSTRSSEDLLQGKTHPVASGNNCSKELGRPKGINQNSSTAGAAVPNGTAPTPLPPPATTAATNVQRVQVQRQRSFKRTDDELIKRSRVQSSSYELSQDLQEKQLEMLERKYGGTIRSRRAARIIQRAFRKYCMNKNFEKLRNSVGERRLSKRLSELGRSNTVWTDRISSDMQFTMGGTALQNTDSKIDQLSQENVRKRIAEIESRKNLDNKLHHQLSLDPSLKIDNLKRTQRKERRRLERSMEIDLTDIPTENVKEEEREEKCSAQLAASIAAETNNNRNSYPELNDSSASDSPQATPVESTVDLHSLDFENLLESKETDILTDSFHSDSIHSDGSQETGSLIGHHKPQALSLSMELEPRLHNVVSKDLHGSCDSMGRLYPESGVSEIPSEVQIKVDLASPEDTGLDDQKTLNEDTIKYYMNTRVKLRGGGSSGGSSGGGGSGSVRDIKDKKGVISHRGPEASPIWKRKSAANSTVSVVNKGEVKRMSNISETSEPESLDGQCSSSPSSDNVSSENISIGSENSISYQRKIRISVTNDQHMTRIGDRERKRLYRIGLNLFNKKPEKGLRFLIERGFVDQSPPNIAKFLITRKGLSKQMIGEYLGNLQIQLNQDVLDYFAEEIDLSGLQVDVALRKFQSFFRMPGEAQKIEKLMEAFAHRYCICNPDQIKNFRNPDTIFLLAFAIIMLNTDLHNSNIKTEKRMKLEDFIKNLRGIDETEDIDRDLLRGIYERIRAQEFQPGVDHQSQVMKVEQTIVGKKPQLALPHRRLVCYCRLYEIHDPYKKEKIGLHQREVFLFNDIILITKIFSKKKTGITYSFKQSFSLYGMQVYLFGTPHYQYGIRLSSNGKVLITFNARNDHDRQKFVEDLKEAILETTGLESLRIEEELQRHRATHNTIDDDSRVLIYDVLKPSDPAVNRLSAPECGLKKSALSNSLLDLCEGQGMKREDSGGSLDSGVASVGTVSGHSRDDSVSTILNPHRGSIIHSNPATHERCHSSISVSSTRPNNPKRITETATLSRSSSSNNNSNKLNPSPHINFRPTVPEGTEV